MLIAVTGCTGLTMPDRPFEDPATHQPIMAKPNLNMVGRTAGSPDNAQGTHFFMINDSGTYFLRKLPPLPDGERGLTAERLLSRAAEAKVRILDQRLDVAEGKRDFPAYLDSNRFLSNLPGTTIFLPVVDLSRQYINGMMYLLTQPDGARPAIVDDRNFYRMAGVKKWVDKGFLNKDIKIPLGVIGSLRTQIEADLLLQNLFLTADAMGLGAWIHGSISPPVLLGDPKFLKTYGPMLGFDVVTPRWRLMDILRWQVPLPRYSNLRSNPIGLRFKGEHLIKGMSPPYYNSMADAVDRRHRGEVRQERSFQRPGAVCGDLQGRLRQALSGGGGRLQRRCDRLRARHLHVHLRDAWSLSGPLRCNPCSRRLAAGASRRTGLLRPLFPQRRDRGSPQPSSRLARVRLFESAS